MRTGRVDLHYRAVLFRVDDKSSGPTYIYMGTWGHDEAIKLAERATLRVNPINGTLEGLIGESARPSSRRIGYACRRHRMPTPELSYLAGVGYTLADLTERVGHQYRVLAAEAMAARDESALVDAAEGCTGLGGQCAARPRDRHCDRHDPREARLHQTNLSTRTLDEDEQIIEALDRPASKMQFAFIEDNDELRRVIEGGDFAAWRIFLHPEQRKYVESRYERCVPAVRWSRHR